MSWTSHALAAVALVVAGALPAPGLVMVFRAPLQRALTADVVVVGKVTAIEKETIDATRFPGDTLKVAHRIAVVQVETGLAGAENLTHVKVGFVPRSKVEANTTNAADPVARGPIASRGPTVPELKEGDEFVFFLTKHPNGGFYVMPNLSPPLSLKDEPAKKEIEAIKTTFALLADPMKGLTSDKAAIRYQTAAALLTKYRTRPDFVTEIDQTPIPAEESLLILKGLLDADWAKTGPDSPVPPFYSIGLTDKDGWVPPKVQRAQPGQATGPAAFNAALKDAYAKWLDGPGKTYRIKRMVAKAK